MVQEPLLSGDNAGRHVPPISGDHNANGTLLGSQRRQVSPIPRCLHAPRKDGINLCLDVGLITASCAVTQPPVWALSEAESWVCGATVGDSHGAVAK